MYRTIRRLTVIVFTLAVFLGIHLFAQAENDVEEGGAAPLPRFQYPDGRVVDLETWLDEHPGVDSKGTSYNIILRRWDTGVELKRALNKVIESTGEWALAISDQGCWALGHGLPLFQERLAELTCRNKCGSGTRECKVAVKRLYSFSGVSGEVVNEDLLTRLAISRPSSAEEGYAKMNEDTVERAEVAAERAREAARQARDVAGATREAAKTAGKTYTTSFGELVFLEEANGLSRGLYTHTKGKDEGDSYQGEIKNNLWHGHGVYEYHSIASMKFFKEIGADSWGPGSRYEGQFSNGHPNGYGVSFASGGERYEGEFSGGSVDGYGIWHRSNGDVHYFYAKQTADTLMESWIDKDRHVVRKFNPKKVSEIEVAENENIHNKTDTLLKQEQLVLDKSLPPCRGNPRNFLVAVGSECIGHLTWEEGGEWPWNLAVSKIRVEEYTGEWRAGVPHVLGTILFKNGDTFEGEFWRNNPTGRGVYHFSSNSDMTFLGRNAAGLKITGNFVHLFRKANATLYWGNGDVWVGVIESDSALGNSRERWVMGERYAAGSVPQEILEKSEEVLTAGTYGEEILSQESFKKTIQGLDLWKARCEELGFTPGTEPFGGCVLRLLDGGTELTAAESKPSALDMGVAVTDLGQRLALVIGNASYSDAPLANPLNDSRLMSDTLRDLSFSVTLVQDVTQIEMKQAIVNFGIQLEDSGPEAVGLFYFAGHGVQVRGRNYLMPVGAPYIGRAADVDVFALDANEVLDQMYFAGNAMNIVLLDACRNNPYFRRFRGTPMRGLARMEAPRGTIISYSTRPGDLASDGTGNYSPYTEALVRAMRVPGLSLHEVFIQTRISVMASTQERQVPWEEGGLTANFYFNPIENRSGATN